MARDFVHTGAVVEAVRAVLIGADGDLHTGGLPANWFAATADEDEEALKLLEHGDLRDYADSDQLTASCPCILVRGLGPTPGGSSGSSGVRETDEIIRVLHSRAYGQCYNDLGEPETNQTRARERYAKIIGRALFHDEPYQRLGVTNAAGERTPPVMTATGDAAGAQVLQVLWRGWDLGADIGNPNSTEDVQVIRRLDLPLWAIACDLVVRVRTGGAA